MYGTGYIDILVQPGILTGKPATYILHSQNSLAVSGAVEDFFVETPLLSVLMLTMGLLS